MVPLSVTFTKCFGYFKPINSQNLETCCISCLFRPMFHYTRNTSRPFKVTCSYCAPADARSVSDSWLSCL